MVENPWVTNFGVIWLTGSVARFIPQRAYISMMELLDSLSLNYLDENGRRNWIIRETSINGSAQFIILLEIWGSRLTFINNPRDPDTTRGWGSTGFKNTPERWGRSVHTSPANFPRSPVWSCPVHDDFLHYMQLERMWRLQNALTDDQGRLIVCANLRARWRRQNRYIFITNPDCLATQ